MIRWIKGLFGKKEFTKGVNDGISPAELVEIINNRAKGFAGAGMVIILQEYYSIKMYVVDGVYKCTWGYNKGVFSIDPSAEPFLQKPVSPMKLMSGFEAELVPSLQKAFHNNDMSVGQLWRLDPNAWDYDSMKMLHQYDFGIRISFKNTNQ